MSWPLVEIGKLVSKVTSWNPLKSDLETEFDYIDLSSVDKDRKIVDLNAVTKVEPQNAPSRARQLVTTNDVLVATVRPNLNGVAQIESELDGATASTGYCVLRPLPKKLDSRYLFHWVQSYSFVSDMMSKATGATYPAVSDKVVKQSPIPLPPLDEQKRIAAILDKADAIRRKRQQAIQLTDDFLRSVFLDMFGDPVTNPKGWEVNSLKSGIEKIESGWSAKGESYPCGDGEKGVLKISSVTSGTFKPSENKYIDSKNIPENRSLVFPTKGDLLFSRANTRELVAATCIVSETRKDVFLPDKLWKVKTFKAKLLPEFLHFMIQHPKFKNVLTSQATGTSGSMLNISKSKFEESLGIFPPLEMQKKFQDIFWKVNKLNASLSDSISCLDINFSSLSHNAFAGEL